MRWVTLNSTATLMGKLFCTRAKNIRQNSCWKMGWGLGFLQNVNWIPSVRSMQVLMTGKTEIPLGDFQWSLKHTIVLPGTSPVIMMPSYVTCSPAKIWPFLAQWTLSLLSGWLLLFLIVVLFSTLKLSERSPCEVVQWWICWLLLPGQSVLVL